MKKVHKDKALGTFISRYQLFAKRYQAFTALLLVLEKKAFLKGAGNINN